MLAKSVKSAFIAACISMTALAAAPANAASAQLELKVGGGSPHQFHRRHGRWDHRDHRDNRDLRRGRPDFRNICQPREALWKASRLGMRRADIQRVLPRNIIVTGWRHGHHARIVFDRTSRHCRVVAKRGI
jgi:hypothetical protein